jgi:hypothetical protein
MAQVLSAPNVKFRHDLPIALLEVWEANGRRPDTKSAAYADYIKINQILKTEEQKEKAGLEPSLLREFEELDRGRLARLDELLWPRHRVPGDRKGASGSQAPRGLALRGAAYQRLRLLDDQAHAARFSRA